MRADNSEHTINYGYAQVNGIRLHYAECGSENRELVILLHGFPEFWYSWRHQLPVLGEHYHTVAPDLRGYNLSDKPEGIDQYTIEQLVKDVVGLIDFFGAEKAAIVGHDWGAGVAWGMAQQAPQRVSKLVVMQVPPAAAWRENLTFRQLLRSWYMLFFQLPRIPEWAIRRNDFNAIDRSFREMIIKSDAFSDADIGLYKEAIRRPGALNAAVNYYRANVRRLMTRQKQDEGVSPRDHRVPMPTLFIFAEKDFAIIPETVRGVKNYVTGTYREVRIPESGHWVQNEAPEEVNRALLEFLKSS